MQLPPCIGNLAFHIIIGEWSDSHIVWKWTKDVSCSVWLTFFENTYTWLFVDKHFTSGMSCNNKYESLWNNYNFRAKICNKIARACISGEEISKSELDTTFWIFPHFFYYWPDGYCSTASAEKMRKNSKCCIEFWLWYFFSWNPCSSCTQFTLL